MSQFESILQHLTPTLATALRSPLAGMASQFILNSVDKSKQSNQNLDLVLKDLVSSSQGMQKLKDINAKFDDELKSINIDIFAIARNDQAPFQYESKKYQVFFSIAFLTFYFLMIGVVFTVEVSDTLNMRIGENSLKGELTLLFGVLTAGVAQVLNYWFGGIATRKS